MTSKGCLRAAAIAAVCFFTHTSLSRSQSLDFVSSAVVDSTIVRNTPYSAESVTSVIQSLTDGTHIERRTTAQVYRDSAGRVRRDQPVLGLAGLIAPGESKRLITVADPAAGVSYVLDPSTHTARRTPLGGGGALENTRGLQGRSRDGRAREGRAREGRSRGGFVPDVGPPPPSLSAPVPPALFVILPDAARTVTKELGTKSIEGLFARGRLTSTTIPTGQIGNDRPIVITDERWESDDLRVVLLSRHHDPRVGDVEYRLTNIKRTEPSAALFTVPADYTFPPTPGSRRLMGADRKE